MLGFVTKYHRGVIVQEDSYAAIETVLAEQIGVYAAVELKVKIGKGAALNLRHLSAAFLVEAVDLLPLDVDRNDSVA